MWMVPTQLWDPSWFGGMVGDPKRVVIVGGGFAGMACAKHLAKDSDLRITLIDRLNYSQFQPLLYQVATAQLGSSDVASPLRTLSIKHPNVAVKLGEVAARRPGRAQRDHADRVRPTRATTWCSPAARSPTSSARRAPPSTPSRCTR